MVRDSRGVQCVAMTEETDRADRDHYRDHHPSHAAD
jgi:hypothetical protein